MYRCPRCRKQLARQSAGRGGLFWHCPKCGGRTASLGLLRRNAEPAAIDELWRSARDAVARGDLPCPACDRRMVEVETRAAGGSVAVDVCTPCRFVWFDASELAALPGKVATPEPQRIPLAARLSE